MRIAFDLDGTLVDSAPDIHAAAVRMLADFGRPALTLEQVRSFIGNGVPKLVERVARASGLEHDHAEMLSVFSGYYSADPTSLSELYPGVADALAVLAADGLPMAICTNKPEAPAHRVLADFDLTARFDRVIGGDSLPNRKPEPDMLFAALEGAAPEACLYVGDSEVDAATARAAGVPFLLFTEGYRKTPVSEIPHDAAFSHWDALVPLIRSRRDAAA